MGFNAPHLTVIELLQRRFARVGLNQGNTVKTLLNTAWHSDGYCPITLAVAIPVNIILALSVQTHMSAA